MGLVAAAFLVWQWGGLTCSAARPEMGWSNLFIARWWQLSDGFLLRTMAMSARVDGRMPQQV
jgi:hypothetical protein